MIIKKSITKTIRITEEQNDFIRKIAEKHNQSFNGAINLIINKCIKETL